MLKKTILLGILSATTVFFSSWGFFAHRLINRKAVFTLPSGMIRFYKNNITYISEHAVDPDKRRYTDSAEATRHFIDADHYGQSPFDSIPEKWEAAAEKYGAAELNAHGTVPWQIQKTYYRLVKAFKERDSLRILRYSSAIGHYISDAHVPLHTTENYNGQLTGQVGIHAFWESRLPELYSDKYDFFTGKARYIQDPLKEAWHIVRHTFTLKDSVLLIEKRISSKFPSDKRYTYAGKNNQILKQYSPAYSKAYHIALKGMVEQQLRASLLETGSFWYSAWIDAGQPDLDHMNTPAVLQEEPESSIEPSQITPTGKPLGRPDL